MTVPSTSCPSCNSVIGDDDEVCAQCDAPVTPFRPVSRTPLILPGNPALSTDDTSTSTTAMRGVGVSLVALVVLGATVIVATQEPAPRTREVSQSATDSAALVSSAVDAGGDTATTSIADVRTENLVAAVTARSAPSAVKAVTPSTPVAAAPAPSAPSASSKPAAAPLTALRAPDTTRTRVPAPATTEAIVQATPTRTASAPATTVDAAPAAVIPVPTLHMTPLISATLRVGEIVRLRGTIQDMTTGRALPNDIRFTSVDPRVARVDLRTGEVTGVAAGRARIIANGGAAGTQIVELSVLAVQKPFIAPTVAASVAPRAASNTPSSTPSSTPPRAATVAVATRQPVSQASTVQIPTTTATVRVDSAAARSVSRTAITPVASAGSAIAPQPLRDMERPDAGDTRFAATRIAADVLEGGRQTAELAQFLSDGASHRVSIAANPTTVGETATGVRVSFELRVSKYDAAGRPVSRMVPVQMDVAKREGRLSMSAVAIGALRKP